MSQSGNVAVSVSAQTTQAQQQFGKLTQVVEKFSQKFNGLFSGMQGKGGGGSAVSKFTKELDAAVRSSERLHRQLKSVDSTLADIQQRKIGASGDALKDLERQEKYAKRRLSQATVRAGAADQTVAALQAQGAPPPQTEKAEDKRGQSTATFVESFAGAMLGPWAKLATAAGAGALLAHVVKSGIGNATGVADISARTGGSEDTWKRLRQQAAGLGFTPDEALGIAGQVSKGGSAMGGGRLFRDSQSSMAYARMFGLDGGSVGAMVGEAGKLGGFNPGDARKFAEMLASAIHKVGMDPRADEMGQATLMLMNSQLRTNPSSDPKTALMMQTLLNKTGIPALQGQNGAGLLARMQGMVTGSMDDPHQAFFQAAMRQSGLAGGFYDMMSLKEKGVLGDSRVFPAMARFAMKNAPSRDAGLYALSDNTGLPFNTLRAWDKKSGGIENMHMASIRKMVESEGTLHAGATKQLDKTGNQIRKGMASFENVTLDASQPIVKGVATLGNWASQEYKTLNDILGTEKTTGQHIAAITEHALGLKPGALGAGGSMVDTGIKFWKDTRPRKDGSGSKFGDAINRHVPSWINEMFDLFNPSADVEYLSPKRKGTGRTPPVLPGTLPGGGPPKHTGQRSSIDIHHYVHEHGVVSHSTKLALKDTIRSVVHELHHEHTMSQPNTNYRRV